MFRSEPGDCELAPYLPDALVVANLDANVRYPQSITAQSVAMGAAAVAAILDGTYSWSAFGRADVTERHRRLAADRMRRAHQAHGIPVVLGDRQDYKAHPKTVTLERLADVVRMARPRIFRAAADWAADTLPDMVAPMPADPPGFPIICSLRAEDQKAAAVGVLFEYRGEAAALGTAFRAGADSLLPTNPPADRLSKRILHDFALLYTPGVRSDSSRRAEIEVGLQNAYEELMGVLCDGVFGRLSVVAGHMGGDRRRAQRATDMFLCNVADNVRLASQEQMD